MANQHAFGPFWMRSNFTPWGKYNLCQYRFYSSNVQTLLLPHWRQFFPINRVLWFLYDEKINVSKYNNGLFTQMKFTCHRDFGNRFFPGSGQYAFDCCNFLLKYLTNTCEFIDQKWKKILITFSKHTRVCLRSSTRLNVSFSPEQSTKIK